LIDIDCLSTNLVASFPTKKDDHAIAIQQVAAQVHGCLGQDLDRQSFSDAVG